MLVLLKAIGYLFPQQPEPFITASNAMEIFQNERQKNIRLISGAMLGYLPPSLIAIVHEYIHDLTFYMACEFIHESYFQKRFVNHFNTPSHILNLPKLVYSPQNSAVFQAQVGFIITCCDRGFGPPPHTQEEMILMARKEIGKELLPEGMVDKNGQFYPVMLSSDELGISILNFEWQKNTKSFCLKRVTIIPKERDSAGVIYTYAICEVWISQDLQNKLKTIKSYCLRFRTGCLGGLVWECGRSEEGVHLGRKIGSSEFVTTEQWQSLYG